MDKLSIALSYLGAEALDRYVQPVSQQTRPTTWGQLKQKLKRRYLAITDEETLEELKQVKQRTTVMAYLRAFIKAASLCAVLPGCLKTTLFVRGLLPEIQNWVYPQHPRDVDRRHHRSSEGGGRTEPSAQIARADRDNHPPEQSASDIDGPKKYDPRKTGRGTNWRESSVGVGPEGNSDK